MHDLESFSKVTETAKLLDNHKNILRKQKLKLNIRTPKKFVVITQKFELCGSTIE